MSKNIKSLKAEVRQERGKEEIKKLRVRGLLPAVVYGANKESISLSLDAHDFKVMTTHNLGDVVLLELQIAGGAVEKVFVREVQKDPVNDQPLHVDLYRVDLSAPVVMSVRINDIGGTPEGVRLGGFVERLRYMVNVKALPEKMPAHIDADLSNLGLNQSYTVSQLPQFDGIEYVDPPNTALFGCKAKSKLAKGEKEAVAAAPAAAAAAAAPAAGGKAAPAAGKAAPAAKAAAPAGKAPAAGGKSGGKS
jgi:large subunit ribosomal protein L25